MEFWREPEPGGANPGGAERRDVGRGDGEGAGGDRAEPGDRGEAPGVERRSRRFGRLLRSGEEPVDIVDTSTTMPNSARCARIVFTVWVRWRMRKSRAL
jgi:hypothetical protein